MPALANGRDRNPELRVQRLAYQARRIGIRRIVIAAHDEQVVGESGQGGPYRRVCILHINVRLEFRGADEVDRSVGARTRDRLRHQLSGSRYPMAPSTRTFE